MTQAVDVTTSIRRKVEARIVEEEAAIQPDMHSPNDTEANMDMSPDEVLKYVCAGQDGDAALFAELNRGRAVFDHTEGKWYLFGEQSWREDLTGEIFPLIDGVVSLCAKAAGQFAWRAEQAAASGNDNAKKDALKKQRRCLDKVSKLQSLQHKQAVLKLAASGTRALGIDGSQWDSNRSLLGFRNGVFDLESMQFRPGRPDDWIKTVIPHDLKGLFAPANTFEQFTMDVCGDNQGLAEYLQRLFGYALSRQSTEHVFPIFHGGGRNGKSTLFEVLSYVLGPLCRPVSSELLLDQGRSRSSAAPSPDLMALRGLGIAFASESGAGRGVDISKVKHMTGGDTAVARPVFGKREITFRPSHTLFLLTNHKPRTDPEDKAFWSRVHLIPFSVSFVDKPEAPNERKIDRNLMKKLCKEASGILAWLLRGFKAWKEQGLNPPEIIRAATENYRSSEDELALFLNERCVTGADYEVQSSTLFKDYVQWAKEMAVKPISIVRFGRLMKKRFQSKDGQCVFYLGIGLSNAVLPRS